MAQAERVTVTSEEVAGDDDDDGDDGDDGDDDGDCDCFVKAFHVF